MNEHFSGTESTRQRNLSRLLRLLHTTGPRSRAALTELTGLNRSTIGGLIGELAGYGLAQEHTPAATRRVGRPSPVVAVSREVATIAVNPEIDALGIAAVGLDQQLLITERRERNSVLTAGETVTLVAECIARWRSGPLTNTRIEAIGVAVPGLVRSREGFVREAPHLGWTNVPLGELMTTGTGLPTVVGNDASLGALAEHLYGAARGIDNAIYLNGGASGIGGGLIIDGRVVAGVVGYAGEFGHARLGLDDGDRRSPTGVLEDEVNRARLLATLGLRTADDREFSRALATASSPEVVAEVNRQRRTLAGAIAGLVDILNPAAVILGGFLAAVAELDLEGMRREVAQRAMPATMAGVSVKVASLAEHRLLVGAAEAAFADLLHNPSGRGPNGDRAQRG